MEDQRYSITINNIRSPEIKDFLENASNIMAENENFLYFKAQNTYDEIVGLANDYIQYIRNLFKSGATTNDFTRLALLYYLNHILQPGYGSIYVNFLLGNVPSCFMNLRLQTESLCTCYLADKDNKSMDFFQDRINTFKEKSNNYNITQLVKRFDKEIGSTDAATTLWKELSEWLHTKGVMNEMVEGLIESSNISAWNLIIPINYCESDLFSLQELGEKIHKFRELLNMAMKQSSPE